MHVLDELDLIEDTVPRSAAMNMAVDEALLQTAARPALRIYEWQRRALSFGYFGSFADVAAHGSERELVRRWTGGGIVFHGDDVTYSAILLGPVTTPSRLIYAQMHRAIQTALPQTMNVALAVQAAPKTSDACFANAVEADLMFNGRKIAGAAQRRTRAGLLHQGSIQFDALPPDFPLRFAAALCPSFRRATLSPQLLREAEVIARDRYGTAEWLRRR